MTREEIEDLMEHDRADEALREAITIGDLALASAAARIVLCSGSYIDETKRLAARYNHDLDLLDIRRQYLED